MIAVEEPGVSLRFAGRRSGSEKGGSLERLAAEACSPLTAQQVIIPSTALRRRVELACADRQGICANIDFSYLAQWLWKQIGQLVDIEDQSPFSPGLLVWRVFERLGDRYLKEMKDEFKRLGSAFFL